MTSLIWPYYLRRSKAGIRDVFDLSGLAYLVWTESKESSDALSSLWSITDSERYGCNLSPISIRVMHP